MAVRSKHLLKPQRIGAAIFFWLVQVFLGLPSIFLALQLTFTGRAEGALYTICLFLAWIGATLAVGVSTIIHGSTEFSLPRTFGVYQATTEAALTQTPEGYEDIFNGYAFRRDGNKVQTLGPDRKEREFRSWADFVRFIGGE